MKQDIPSADSIGIRLKNLLSHTYTILNNIELLQCIRESMIKMVPIILIGAFALTLRSFPIAAYDRFIQTFCGGIIYRFFDLLYNGTFGMLSVYATISISWCYCSRIKSAMNYSVAPIFTALTAFFIMSGFFTENGGLSVLNATGIFTALVCGISATALFCHIFEHLPYHPTYFTYGADDSFHLMITNLIPMLASLFFFTGLNLVLTLLSGQDSFQSLYVSLLAGMFHKLGGSMGSSLVYLLLVHLMWFFGIHGANVLESASQDIFYQLGSSTPALSSGVDSLAIYSKDFFNVFVLMGGCGSTFCLMIAIFLFSKKRSTRNLAKLAALPSILNINEVFLFGLPVTFNPIFVIPFFLTPIACLITSSLATQWGLVPLVTTHVEWTTPILFGGYVATGSVAGSLLQGFNLVLGVAIYRPFVRIMDAQSTKDRHERMNRLVEILQESEAANRPVALLKRKDNIGLLAKDLAEDLKSYVKKELPTLYYQPQFDKEGRCIGAESLLRWQHPVFGMIYPPLVVQLAQEIGILTELEKNVVRSMIADMDQLHEYLGADSKISVNVTGTTIQLDEYEDFLKEIHEQYPQYARYIEIEITEQAALTIDMPFVDRLTRIKEMGYEFAIDDFSMGSTSIKYLQTTVFSLIKLDGSLTRDILENDRNRRIVASLTKLSHDFGLQILAEYIETETQRKTLEDMGCYLYQGYLYSPAVKIENLIKFKQA